MVKGKLHGVKGKLKEVGGKLSDIRNWKVKVPAKKMPEKLGKRSGRSRGFLRSSRYGMRL